MYHFVPYWTLLFYTPQPKKIQRETNNKNQRKTDKIMIKPTHSYIAEGNLNCCLYLGKQLGNIYLYFKRICKSCA